MNWKDKLKKLNTALYINNHFPNYINKWVFRIAFLLIFSQFIYIASVLEFDFSPHAYIECKSNQPCQNTFFECQNKTEIFQDFMIVDCEPYNKVNCVDEVCSKPILEPFEILGNKPPKEYDQFKFNVFILIMFAFIINHFIYLIWGKKIK